MKIKALLLTLIAGLSLTRCSFAGEKFSKLTPLITKKANSLNQNYIKNLNTEEKQIFLNFLAFFNTIISEETPMEIIEINLQCGKHIQEAILKSPALQNVVKQFYTDTDEILILYRENIQNKVTQENIEIKDVDKFFKKFQEKMAELFDHISKLYYETVYKSVLSDSSDLELMYMFDAQGEISAEKRTQPLPAPAL